MPAASMVVALSVPGCDNGTEPGLGPAPGPVATASVSVADNRFTPDANAVSRGEAVTWTWAGANPHNVTFDDPAAGNSTTQSTGSFTMAFPNAGEYTYFCTVHGRAVMSGWVVVEAAASTGGGYGTP